MAGKGKRGPATLCTPELIAAMAEHIEAGASLKATCAAEGIDRSTITKWLQKAKEGKEPYAGTVTPLKRAIAVAVREAEKRVFRGDLQWQSSARWLESMRPARWRRTKRQETTLKGGGKPIPVDVKLGEELLRKMIEESARPGVPGLAPPGGGRFGKSGRN